MDELFYYYELAKVNAFLGIWGFPWYRKSFRLILDLSKSNWVWKPRFFFLCGGNWEFSPKEVLNGGLYRVQ